MFGLFHKKHDVEDSAQVDRHSSKIIKACTLTSIIIIHVNVFLNQYNQETGAHIVIKVCENEYLLQSPNAVEMPLNGSGRDLHNWIQEYQSSPCATELPHELDQHSKEYLSGYDSDDSYEYLFEQIRDSYAKRSDQVAWLAFAVSPWSDTFDCEDCVRIVW